MWLHFQSGGGDAFEKNILRNDVPNISYFKSHNQVCKACVLLAGLNKGLPQLGVGKSSKHRWGALCKMMLPENSMFFVFFFSSFRKTLAELEIDGAIPKREEVVTPLSLPQPLDHLDQLSLETSRES